MAGDIPVYCSHDELVDIVKIVGNPRNPNKHDDNQIELLARIIKEQGWRKPITVSNRSGFVVSGHGRLAAAIKLKATVVPVDYQDYATEADEWADLIADNRIAEFSTIDEDMLSDLLAEINDTDFDMLLTGYEQEEIDALLDFDHEEITDAFATPFDTLSNIPRETSTSNKTSNTNDNTNTKKAADYNDKVDKLKDRTGEIDIDNYDEENYTHECPRCNFKW